MTDSVNSGRFFFLNPWLLHLQKMCLELKCPLCLNLLNRPLLIPCNHILCSSCIPRSTEFGSKCPVCISPFVDKDLRPAPHMERMVHIYKSMDAAFGSNRLHWVPQNQIDAADFGRTLDQYPITFTTVIDDILRKESIDNMRKGTSSNPKSSSASFTC
ncbi:BRCA1-associated RING domain protein 1-like [Macadamia integrifolia]|uniref:BRCA1-associated RING domain protein 1-like n=1 Tax=Macadamia integrifolia TaxID=60698 RepID=UPI001C4F31ED|nr:BRCA1-associated RING domain protein 1-like [Macadamia integrifolia]